MVLPTSRREGRKHNRLSCNRWKNGVTRIRIQKLYEACAITCSSFPSLQRRKQSQGGCGSGVSTRQVQTEIFWLDLMCLSWVRLSRLALPLGILVLVFLTNFYILLHNWWLMTAYLPHINHRNDTLLVSRIPSGFGMGPSVPFPALSSSVFRTNLKRQQRELYQKVFVPCDLYHWLSRTACWLASHCWRMLGRCELSQ